MATVADRLIRVYHRDAHGFDGAGSILVLVGFEDDEKIEGKTVTEEGNAHKPITVMKENVAAWIEIRGRTR